MAQLVVAPREGALGLRFLLPEGLIRLLQLRKRGPPAQRIREPDGPILVAILAQPNSARCYKCPESPAIPLKPRLWLFQL